MAPGYRLMAAGCWKLISLESPPVASSPEASSLRSVGFAPDALHRDVLRLEHLVLQRIHARCGLVDVPDERDRPLQDRLDALPVLDARLRVFVLDDEVRVGDVEFQQIPGRELVVEPVDRAVL